RAGRAYYGSRPSGLRHEADAAQRILLGVRVPEAHVAELHGPRKCAAEGLALFGIAERGFGIEDVGHAVGRDRRARQHDEDHRHHEEGHDDLHRVLHEGHHVADAHRRLPDLLGAYPDDEEGDSVHDEHHRRHHEGHDAVDEERVPRQVLVRPVEALLLDRLSVEGAGDHHAREPFPAHERKAIDELADDLEPRHRDLEDDRDEGNENGHCQGDDPPHGGVLAQGVDDAAYAYQGRIDHRAYQHDDDHLHLHHVVVGPRYQRGGGELVELALGEALDLGEYRRS